jgi:hypothetical protein
VAEWRRGSHAWLFTLVQIQAGPPPPYLIFDFPCLFRLFVKPKGKV